MSRDIRYTYQYRMRCDVTRLNLPGHMIAVGTPAIRHIYVNMCKIVVLCALLCSEVQEGIQSF